MVSNTRCWILDTRFWILVAGAARKSIDYFRLPIDYLRNSIEFISCLTIERSDFLN